MKIPRFKNESEEARWWDAHRKDTERLLTKAAEQGTLMRSSAKRKGATPTTTIRLDPEDIRRARDQAEQRGLRYQTYLKMLVRQALSSEEKKSKRRKAS